MRRHLLRKLSPAAILQVLSNARSPERVITNPRLNSSLKRPPLDHPKYISLGEGIRRELPRFRPRGAK